MATPRSDRAGSGLLDAIEGLALEIADVQARVAALERRMDTREADPGPELIARRIAAPALPPAQGWERFERRARALTDQLSELEHAARRAAGR